MRHISSKRMNLKRTVHVKGRVNCMHDADTYIPKQLCCVSGPKVDPTDEDHQMSAKQRALISAATAVCYRHWCAALCFIDTRSPYICCQNLPLQFRVSLEKPGSFDLSGLLHCIALPLFRQGRRVRPLPVFLFPFPSSVFTDPLQRPLSALSQQSPSPFAHRIGTIIPDPYLYAAGASP